MVAVHPSYQREGRGETLLSYLERRALHMGITQLFVLSTRTMQWFEERGKELRLSNHRVWHHTMHIYANFFFILHYIFLIIILLTNINENFDYQYIHSSI